MAPEEESVSTIFQKCEPGTWNRVQNPVRLTESGETPEPAGV